MSHFSFSPRTLRAPGSKSAHSRQTRSPLPFPRTGLLFLLSLLCFAGAAAATPLHSSNLVADPSFESGTLQTPILGAFRGTVSIDSSEALTGTSSLRFSAAQNLAFTTPWRLKSEGVVTAISGQEAFELSAWVKADAVDRPVKMFMFCLDETYEYTAHPFASRSFVVGTEWQKISMTHTCADGSDFASFRLQVDAAGSIAWWDDVSFSRIAMPGSNLLADGGFESGALVTPFDNAWLGSLALDGNEAAVGNYSLRFTSSAANSFTRPYRLSPEAAVVALGPEGGSFRLSAVAKAATADTNVRLRIFCLDDTYEFSSATLGTGHFTLGTAWQNLSLDHTCAPGTAFTGVRLDVVGDGSVVWWDDLRLQEVDGPVNSLPNPDVESGALARPFLSAFQGNLAVDSTVSLTGSRSLRLKATNNNDGFTNPWTNSSNAAILALSGESTLRFSAWGKADGAGVPVQLRIFCLDENYDAMASRGLLSQSLGTDWQQMILDHTCPSDAAFASARLDVDQNGATAWWDAMAFSLLASTPANGGSGGGGSGGGGSGGPSQCDNLSASTRGWATVGEGTLLSDQGTPLRGVWWNFDQGGTAPPTPAQVASVKERGLNTIHVYAERSAMDNFATTNCQGGPCCQLGDPDFDEVCWRENILNPGYSQEALCELVSEAAEQGLYVMITIGESVVTQEGGDWIRAFWTHYAPILGQQQNVIFEIKNESITVAPANGPDENPGTWNWIRPYHRDSYEIIRQSSAEVPVLFYSYAHFRNPAGALEDIAWLNNNVSGGVDWTRAAIAFHGYSSLEETQASVDAVKNAGYAVIETEGTCPVATGPDGTGECVPPYFPLLEQHENNHTSWMSFLKISGATETTFNIPMENEGFLWAADEGTWPGSSNPPVGQVISLKAPLNSSYVAVGSDGSLVADSAQATASTRFQVVAMGRYVALKSEANGLYVSPRPSDQQLEADTTTPFAFEWIDRPDGQVTLQSTGSRHFVSARYTDSSSPAPLKGVAKRGGLAWEGFEWEVNGGDPIVTLQQPSSGTVKAGDPLLVTAAVSHPAGTAIERVDFHYGPSGNMIASDASAPYQRSLPTTGQAHNSAWSVYAVAYDVDGGSASTNPVTVTFDAQAPVPSITSPSSGATVSGVVPVVVNLGGAGDIATVQLFIDDVGQTPVGPPFQLEWNTSGYADGPHTLKVVATDHVGHTGMDTVDVDLDNTVPPLCVPDAKTLCLQDRFAVTLSYPPQANGDGQGNRIDFSEETGFFWFFGADNYEAMVKIVDGRCAPAGSGTNDHWWFYYGGLTSIQYTLTVTDKLTGATKQYSNSPDPVCGGADTQLFNDPCPTSSAVTPVPAAEALLVRSESPPTLSAATTATTATTATALAATMGEKDEPLMSTVLDDPKIRWQGLRLPAGDPSAPTKSGSCVAGNNTLCLHDNRIAVTVDWVAGSQSGDGRALPIAGSDRSGLFWFFAPDRLELAIKVIDGINYNGNWWVYFGVLTDVDYTVTVTDTVSGASKQYNNNQIPTYCGVADISAIDQTP